MEMYPQLATGSPSFGSSKIIDEETWNNVAEQINVLRPPIRSCSEWKKIVGICDLSSAAVPSGTILGACSKTHTPIHTTSPRKTAKVAAVRATTLKERQNASNLFSPNISSNRPDHQQKSIINSTKEKEYRPVQQNKKRKSTDHSSDRLKLIHQQTEIQRKTLEIMEKHAEAAKMQAEASKVLDEAAKLNAESAVNNTKVLAEISVSLQVVATAFTETIKLLKDEH